MENGLAISKDDISLSTGKIVINGVEITDTESWHKALETFNNLLKQLEAYENMRKEAIEYVKEFTFEPLLVNEDRKLIMYNENLKNFENILNKVGGDNE